MRAFSYGGGVQSTACLVLAASGKLDIPLFLFSNVGEQAENPDTLRYVNEVAMPYAKVHGIELVELRKTRKDGTPVDLYEYIMTQSSGVPIPARVANGAPGKRDCTHGWKMEVIAKELKARGATSDDPAILGLGISADEIQRARTGNPEPHIRRYYPLIDMRIIRANCVPIIQEAGIPVPPKSACFFCPYHSRDGWLDLARNKPHLFEKSVALERRINEINKARGDSELFLTRYGKPINEIIKDDGQLSMFEDDLCESGYCMV